MAVEIKGGQSSDLASVDSVSKALRVTNYGSDGVEGHGFHPVPEALATSEVEVLGNDVIGSLDVSEYRSLSVQLKGTFSATVSFQGSNDNSNFFNVVSQDTTSLTTPYVLTGSAPGLFKIPVVYKYLRARVTAYTSGTVSAAAFGYKDSTTLAAVGQIGTVTLAAETSKVIGTVNVATSPTASTGTIDAADTALPAPANDGVMVSGTPSVGSTVALNLSAEDSAWALDITGTLGGATFYFEASASSTDGVDGNWVSLNGRKTGVLNSVLASNTTTEGSYRGTLAAMSYFRVRAVGGVGITAVVNIRVGHGTSAVFLAGSLPEGLNTIGSVDNVDKLGGQTVAMGGGVVTAGTQRVTVATDTPVVLGAGTDAIGSVSVSNLPATQAVSGGVSIVGATSLSPFYAIGATGTNQTSVSAAPSILRSVVFTNLAATPRHLKLYDIATTPVAGAGTPVIVCSLAAAGTLAFPLPVEGFPFSNGIGYTMVLGAANNSASPATTAPDFTVSMIYSA